MTATKKQSGMKCLVYVKKDAFTTEGTGDSLKVTVTKTDVLAGQRNATLNRSAETIDATSKDTAGNWMESIPGFKSWGVECESCYIADDASYQALEKAYLDGVNIFVAVCFGDTTNAGVMTGEATITDFPIELPYNDLASYSLTLQGSGALSKGKLKQDINGSTISEVDALSTKKGAK